MNNPLFIKRLAIISFYAMIILEGISCKKLLELADPSSSPVAVYDEAWTVLDQRYALFPLKNVDWHTSYEQYKPINEASNNQLFSQLTALLETLHDGHISLTGGGKSYTYDHFYTGYPANFNFDNLITNYLHHTYRQTGPMIYTIQDSVGYLYFGSFESDVQPAQLDTVFLFMQNTKGLIVDVRNNKGGNSENAALLYQRFLSEKKMVKFEIPKISGYHDNYGEQIPLYIENMVQPYIRPVCLLTNRSCFSACNDYVMFMSQLENVIQIGDQTGGGGGIPMSYILVNGWILHYTSTMTLTPEGLPIENGIIPEISIGITSLQEQSGRDPILEKAFYILQ